MKYLFWNTKISYKHDKSNIDNINSVLINIVKAYGCEFIVLAEYGSELDYIVNELNNVCDKKFFICNVDGYGKKDRLKILSVIVPDEIEIIRDTGNYKIINLKRIDNKNQLIAAVHFPSKGYDKVAAFLMADRLREDIEDIENKFNTKNTIVVGDFNMNPFEEGMVSCMGLHAISSRYDSLKMERSVSSEKYKMFYNPMWSFMGEISKSNGTYYYDKSGTVCYFWNTFDQVIIRPDIIDKLKEESIEIIRNVNGAKLCNDNGRPNAAQYSDHLPLYFELYD